jgi:hypothetical protein
MSNREPEQTVASTTTGIFQGFDVTHGQFGQQYTTIDGVKFITYFDLADPKLKGLRPGCRVEFTMRAAPTVLCHSPHVQEWLPSAEIRRVLPEGGRKSWA